MYQKGGWAEIADVHHYIRQIFCNCILKVTMRYSFTIFNVGNISIHDVIITLMHSLLLCAQFLNINPTFLERPCLHYNCISVNQCLNEENRMEQKVSLHYKIIKNWKLLKLTCSLVK